MPLICLHGLLTLSPILTVLFYHFRMYGAFADTEPAGGFAHGGAVLDDICGQLAGSLLNISLQDPTLPIPICSMYMLPGAGTCGEQGIFAV